MGGELGTNSEWRAGLSYLQLRPDGRQYVQTDVFGNAVLQSFSGRSQLTIADFVWKWAPNGNATRTSFTLQGEYFWRRETGDLTFDADGVFGLTNTSGYSSRQSGWYLDGVYSSCRRGESARVTTVLRPARSITAPTASLSCRNRSTRSATR